MKKIIVLFTLLLFCVIVSFSVSAYDNEEFYQRDYLKGTTLNVYNWGEYISEEDDPESYMFNINKAFEKLTGINVNYSNYASNEDMYAKLKSGGSSYDVVIPSDYMIERLKKENLIEKLDFSNIPNYKNVDEKYKGLYFDENNEYSVAYCVSTVGLIYNTAMVDEKPTSWSILWNPKYSGKILMFDNPRDGFAIAQKLLGQSLNTTDTQEWQLACEQLIAQKPILQGYVQDEVYNKMEGGEAALAPYYAGDAICMMEVNPDLDFCYPEEGFNIFVDSACIPACTQNKEAAELYINFLQDPVVALANAYATGYATPNKVVREMDEYSELASNPYLYPTQEHLGKAEYFFDLDDDTRALMSELWNEVKKSGDNGTSLYIAYGVTITAFIIFFTIRLIRKKKRESYY